MSEGDDLKQAKKDLKKAWEGMRQAGGSIIGHSGYNHTGLPGNGTGFAKYASDLCASDPEYLRHVIDMINAAVADAKLIEEMNAIPTTNPKCHSKPMVKLSTGCLVKYWMAPRNKNESDCGGGPGEPEEPET